MGLEERGYPNLGYASPDTQWVFCMDTLLEAIGIVLETYFRFGFPNAYAIGDSLTGGYTYVLKALFSFASKNFLSIPSNL